MKVVTFFNNKGGVGKTTLAVNTAAYIVKKLKKRVLFVDADPQSNATQMVVPEQDWESIYSDNRNQRTLKNVFRPIFEGTPEINSKIYVYNKKVNSEYRFYFDIILGHPEMSANEDLLSDAWQKYDFGSLRKTNWLYQLANKFSDEYDIIFVDVGPSLGALNRSILLNSDYIVTPMGSDVFSLMGISNIGTWIKKWRKIYNQRLESARTDNDDNNFDIQAERLLINLHCEKKTQLCGYSILQYNAKKGNKYKNGRRAVKAYDVIISQIPKVIEDNLDFLIPDKLKGRINLGDVPYLNSIIPMSQSSNTPLFDLNSESGVRGSQFGVVKKTENMLKEISENILNNIGEA